MQLSMPDIDRVEAFRATRQQDLREATGRSAEVETGAALHHEAEMVKCGRKLHAAARHPWMRRRSAQHAIDRERVRCLANRLIIGGYQAGRNRGLRLGAALEQPALDEQKVSAFACGHRHWIKQRRAAVKPDRMVKVALTRRERCSNLQRLF